jgi:hypothetical protein
LVSALGISFNFALTSKLRLPIPSSRQIRYSVMLLAVNGQAQALVWEGMFGWPLEQVGAGVF